MPPALMVRGLRGATTVDEDSVAQVTERSQELIARDHGPQRAGGGRHRLRAVHGHGGRDEHFPATAIREIGFGAVPLLCAAEIAVPGAMPRCIRVLLHVHTTKGRGEIHHVYLHGAQGLRDDLPD